LALTVPAIQEPIATRPASQHRHSGSVMPGSLPKSRPHSSSLSVSSSSAHRVTRRKSMSSTAANNVAAMVAAAKGTIGAPLEGSSVPRRLSKPASQFRGPTSLHPDMASSMPGDGLPFSPGSYNAAIHSEAITDGPALASMPEHEKGNSKSRNRRASEGASRLLKGEGKRTSGSDLRCEKCGKGYKHSSCLTKHLSVPLSLPPSSHTLSHLMTNALCPLASYALCLQLVLRLEVLR